ncbi:MAG: LPD7 domain-containing protein, partial [Gallionella sp.]
AANAPVEVHGSKNASRDGTKRAERRVQRAAARAQLRQRFAHYCRLVRHEDIGYSATVRELRAERSQKLQAIRAFDKADNSHARKDYRIGNPDRLSAMAEIYIENIQLKLHVESDFQDKSRKLRALRVPPLGWREWLYEQSNLGDQAALSALRGIVYQAQRDAKRGSACAPDVQEFGQAINADAYREEQFKIVMSRLLEEEKREIAIRAAQSNSMRPFEVDALLRGYANMQWRVTGNGNVEYSDKSGVHKFTDRGNRITFDRVHVTDEEICYALMHARQKFGNQLTLTGDDPVFVARMACQASDMGIQILNPELQLVIAGYRHQCELDDAEELRTLSASDESMEVLTQPTSNKPEQRKGLIDDVQLSEQSASLPIGAPVEQTPQERLRTLVLAIDPLAEFVMPDSEVVHVQYHGPIAVTLPTQLGNLSHGFAQHLGRGVYALHLIPVPENHNEASLEVHYRDGQLVSCAPENGAGKGRGE